jgi:hypothetical protein
MLRDPVVDLTDEFPEVQQPTKPKAEDKSHALFAPWNRPSQPVKEELSSSGEQPLNGLRNGHRADDTFPDFPDLSPFLSRVPPKSKTPKGQTNTGKLVKECGEVLARCLASDPGNETPEYLREYSVWLADSERFRRP